MQTTSKNMDKGKQKAREPDAAAPSAMGREASGSTTPEPMNIPSGTIHSRFSQGGESVLSQSPSFSNDCERRPSHTRAKSSLGSAHTFDFFGPSSLASNSTAATSFRFGSPRDSPKMATAAYASESEYEEQRGSLEDTIDANQPRTVSEEPTFESEPGAVNRASYQSSQESEMVERSLGRPSAPMPPLYPEETLPSYEEAPEYTPPLSQPSCSNSRSKTSAFRTAAANRFLSSRIAKKLNLPPALQSRLQGTQTPGASSSSQSASNYGNGRLRFVRSDSAPNLTQLHIRRRVEIRNYAATAYVDGARMGPAPRRSRPASSSRPCSAGVSAYGSRSNTATVARPSTGVTNTIRSQTAASPILRTAVSSASSSRRNSGESRPPSRATISSAPNGGLFTCGYNSGRSGATTPTRPSLSSKIRSRNVSLKSLGDIFSVNRSRADTPSEPEQSRSSGPVTREVVSPVSHELLISARVHPSSGTRPKLMNAAHSSPRAGIDASASGSPVLISPLQSQKRKPDSLQRLPREVILTIFKSLMDLHVQEHETLVKSGAWRGKKANETRWVGMEAAFRELARLSHVSRAWQSYVLDGQLWQKLEFCRYPEMAEEAMINVAEAVGPFVKTLNLHGLAGLRSSVLLALSKAQHPKRMTQWGITGSASLPFATCQLEELDMQGCRQISTSALNTVLSQSPNLKKCMLSSLPCVDNTTLCVLAATATKLEVLDISRCRSVDGEGIRAIFAIQECEANVSTVSKERNIDSRLRELRASGVSGFDAETMSQVGRHWPNLEALDLSYCGDVNNAAITALVSSEGDVVNENGNFITLTPRQADSQQDEEVVRRSFPRLKRLNLSSCRALTDGCLVSLSHAVPHLEVLELANIGPALKDNGLVKLFSTTPQLRKIDLERATHITDAVLSALTPPESHAEAFGQAVPDSDTLMHGIRPRGSLLHVALRSASRRRHASTAHGDAPPTYGEEAVAALIPAAGTHLTHIILSSANRLTSAALLLLINRCPFLTHLELDDTHADNEVAMHFVQLARYREVRNAYLSLVDCRSFSRDTYLHLDHAEHGGVRPRNGSRGYEFRQFCYDDPEPTPSVPDVGSASAEGSNQQNTQAFSSSRRSSIEGRDRGHDECNEFKPVLKSFWGWQMVDARLKQKKKAEERASVFKRQGGRSKVSSIVAMALGMSPGEPRARQGGQAGTLGEVGPRWSRVLIADDGGQGNVDRDDGDDDDGDVRGCAIM
ncbi:uncharacterized protein MEPE_00625 [Melanopsichium pennsylvanicum]|uniref:F-box domain-containing protein n=2 Tax=Melanopsichium pennsylvanicum TaxID=63383 RepID=A0AAJ4XG95_9BASI|nr:hypothetical protein BN887_05424 [Melanopsichium pennsylvanicum 4]SNX81920.1 uncharacterized protein MEPE_00625 [Melanopsichium pennsylvanicum]